jgi:ribosome-associated protein
MGHRPESSQREDVVLRISDTVAIQDWELSEQFTRSSGPGGQNVNKVSTAVELRFEAERSPSLPGPVKARLRRLAGSRWVGEEGFGSVLIREVGFGSVIIRVEDTRHQARNREIARERLAELVRKALVAPKRRVPTKPTRGSVRRRLEEKAKRGEVKAGRREPDL